MASISNTRSTFFFFFFFYLMTFLFIHIQASSFFKKNIQSSSFSFAIENFNPNMIEMHYEGDAYPSSGVIQLTKNERDADLSHSAGRASLVLPVQLWSATIGAIANFITNFTFSIKEFRNEMYRGDGVTFFLAPYDSKIPPHSDGGYLGLFDETDISASKPIVAVEFDSYQNSWDPSYDHIGIDVNSIESANETKWNYDFQSGEVVHASVTYESASKKLSVFIYDESNVATHSLEHIVDLSELLPEWVRIGFSGSSGVNIQANKILSWEFESHLDADQETNQNINKPEPVDLGRRFFQ